MSRNPVQVTIGVKKAERFPISRQRKPGQPAHRPIGDTRLTKNERDYYDAVLQAFAAIPNSIIEDQFIAPVTTDVATPIAESITEYQQYLSDLTVFQFDQSGSAIFNAIKRNVAADWATLEKAETPSEWASSLQFNRASTSAISYATMSAANMVTDMVDSQITAVRNVVAQAYKDGLTRPQTSNRLIQLLNDMPAPRGTPTGLAGAANIFGDATRGLTNRYAMAVYNRCQKIMEQNPTMTPRQLKKYADTYGTKLRNSRARTIARTEMMRASNQGRLMGMIDAADQGLVNPTLARKQWVTSRFDVCPVCVPLSGVTVGIKESFGAPGQAPPAHPNCRCTIRMLPDPATYGTPTTFGGTQPNDPIQFRPQIRFTGAKLEDLLPSPGVGGTPGVLVGQPGAGGPMGDVDPLLGINTKGMALIRQNEKIDFGELRGPLGGKADYKWTADDFPNTMTGEELARGNFRDWPDSSSRADWLDEVKPMKLEQSKEMGLYQSIQEQGIGYPIDVSTYPDGSMRIMSGAHRIAVAEDLGLKEVPVRYWGAQYESVFGKFSNYDKDELMRLKEYFPQRGHGRLGYANFEPGEIPVGGRTGPQGQQGFAQAEAQLRAREARLAALETIDSGPVTPPAEPLLSAPATTEAVTEISEEVRAEGTALIKELREQSRKTAQQQFDQVTGDLERLTDVDMDVSGVLARPPKVKWVRDPAQGRVRIDVATGEPVGGEWDWYWDIPEKQKVRMRRRGVFAEPGQKAMAPDELADKILSRTGGEIATQDEAIEFFLDVAQRRFTFASLKDGRGNLVRDSVDNKMIPELEESGYAWNILTNEIDDEVIVGVMEWANGTIAQTVDEIGSVLRTSRHGTNPWEMEINEYWTELYDVAQKRRAIQPLRVTDDFGPEYALEDRAIIERFDELVPPNLIDDASIINTKEGIINLHLDIVEQAAIEGFT